ncbi:MAG: 2-C-methyl-D-erythritol 4-phosphate cytidylyltransferase [Ekhidna sp.]
MKRFAIIVAGGSGTRMKSDVPKQFLRLDGIPIIIRTLERFKEADDSISLIVVLPEPHFSLWEELERDFPIVTQVQVVFGGETRSDSVRAGLDAIDENGLVAIHDAVRPFVPSETILESYTSAQKYGSGVAYVALKDSLRKRLSSSTSEARNREEYVLVQTPQTFRVDALKDAYSKAGSASFSDDATVFERAGNEVFLVPGSYENIKITTPEDIK